MSIFNKFFGKKDEKPTPQEEQNTPNEENERVFWVKGQEDEASTDKPLIPEEAIFADLIFGTPPAKEEVAVEETLSEQIVEEEPNLEEFIEAIDEEEEEEITTELSEPQPIELPTSPQLQDDKPEPLISHTTYTEQSPIQKGIDDEVEEEEVIHQLPTDAVFADLAPVAPPPTPQAPAEEKPGFWGKLFGAGANKEQEKQDLNEGLKKSSESIFSRLSKAIAGRTEIDMDVLDAIEEALVASDISVSTVIKIINRLEQRAARDKYLNEEEVYNMLKDEIIALLTENNTPDYTQFDIPNTKPMPYIMLVVGVNGAGKTTTIGKLAYQFTRAGKTVMLGAADTFRAAAVEQLSIWAERIGVPIVKQGTGADPAAVAYDTVQSAIAKGIDVVLIDTAGRLHNKKHLMDELTKIRRVVQKINPSLPHDVMLIVDGSTGQNALLQAQEFTKATDVSCITITKLDGTAKGGVVIGIADQFKIPIKYIGVGEKADQLQVFNKREFVDSLFRK